jgi:hypothetical protein
MQIGKQEIVRFGGLQDTCKIMLFQNSNQNVETIFRVFNKFLINQNKWHVLFCGDR